jgi:hypothetical protein
MISRGLAEERMVFLAHARSRLEQWQQERQRAGADWDSDPALRQLTEELGTLAENVRMALYEAGRPSAFEIFGEHHSYFSKRSLDLHPSFAPHVAQVLTDAMAFYKEILLAPRRAPSEANTMTDKRKRLDEKDAQRLRLLDAVYELTDGDTRAYTSHVEAYERAGLDEDDGVAAAHFLAQSGLLQGTAGHVSLTHEGVDERERALRNEGSRTDHFSAAAVQQVFNIHGSVNVLQTGQGAIASGASQRVGGGLDSRAVSGLLSELVAEARALPEPDREEAVQLAEKIEAHAVRTPFEPERLTDLPPAPWTVGLCRKRGDV